MFSETFDWIIVAILAFCAIALLSGKGDFILTSFRNKAEKDKPLPYEKRKFSIAMGLLCVLMLVGELVFIFLADTYPFLIWVVMIAVVLGFVAAILYLKKYAQVDDDQSDK